MATGADGPTIDYADADAAWEGPGGDRGWPSATDAGLPTRIIGWLRVAGLTAGATYAREIEAGRGFLWIPVFFGLGILIYFGLPREPSAVVLAAIAAVSVLAALSARQSAFRLQLLVALAAIGCGLATAKVRTDLLATPMLERERSVEVTGWVEDRTRLGEKGARLRVRVVSIAGVPQEKLPHRVQFTVRAEARDIAFGDAITARARLGPPNGPAMPGGHDFARDNYYRGVGGTGFSFGAPSRIDLGTTPLGIRLLLPLERLREDIGRRIQAALPGEAGAIAVALTVGDQGGIPEKRKDSLRISGLAHILSISGLHMVLVAGTAFGALRAFLALFPGLALRYPIKKWSAAGALAVATIYLGISGADVPTQRSWVMLAIMLTAILFDRRAISVRNVALATMFVLLVTPESLLSASFQMSFGAVLALVAGYEAVAAFYRNRSERLDAPRFGILRKVRLWAGGATLTSLLAGAATAPFAAFHFQRVASLSLLANLAAEPFVGLIVMPMALASVLVMPLGLEPYPLWVMGQGLAVVTWISDTVAAWSGDSGAIRMFPLVSLLLLTGGFLWLALWRERWRLLGLVPMALAFPVALLSTHPDILVDAKGTTMAVRGADGAFRILGGKGASFAIETWLRADGDPREPTDPTLRDGVRCDPLGCTALIGRTDTVAALALDPRALVEDCGTASVVAGAFDTPACAAHAVIGREALRTGGAQAIYIEEGKFRIRTAYPAVRRAWMPPAPEPR